MAGGQGKILLGGGSGAVAKKKGSFRKTGLKFPVDRIGCSLIAGKYTRIVTGRAAVYFTAVLECLAAEVLELAGNAAKDTMMTPCIGPRHMELVTRKDEELSKLLRNAMIVNGCAIPDIEELSNLLDNSTIVANDEPVNNVRCRSIPKTKRNLLL